MKKTPTQIADKISQAFLSSYGECIKAVHDLLMESRITVVHLDYDILEPRVYNVCDTSGEYGSYLIVKVILDNEAGGLVLISDSGEKFPIGTDENGQDNYTVVNPGILLRKVAAYVESFKARQLRPTKKNRQEMIAAIGGYIGKKNAVFFEKEFDRPQIFCESVVYVSDTEVETISSDGTSRGRYQLGALPVSELAVIVDAVNRYVLYLHNKS